MVGRLTVKTERVEEEQSTNQSPAQDKYAVNPNTITPRTDTTTPSSTRSYSAATPRGMRGSTDLRSPGVAKTPNAGTANPTASPLPDLITQTDKHGNATTPRNAPATANTSPLVIQSKGTDETEIENEPDDACESLLESFRMMCCCILPSGQDTSADDNNKPDGAIGHRSQAIYPTRQIMKEDVDINHGNHDIRLLPSSLDTDYCGKKCLVLDLDETLVHSSFRAVPGADFVIPVQIEDVVHFVYVIKRPGVDEFLLEMSKHFEIVIYTASLNKYADPLLDLLDPHKTIQYRLFRESCVYYEGSYVKDLSVLNRDISQTIIVDNSPASYIFHPENAIDCSSFIDDPADRELLQIGSFLKGVRSVKDVRGMCELWRQWPRMPKTVDDNLVEYPEGYDKSSYLMENERHGHESSNPLEV